MKKDVMPVFVSPRMYPVLFSSQFSTDERAKLQKYADIFNYKLVELSPTTFEIINEKVIDGKRVQIWGHIRKVRKYYTDINENIREYFVVEYQKLKKQFLLDKNDNVIHDEAGQPKSFTWWWKEDITPIITNPDVITQSLEIMNGRGYKNIKSLWKIGDLETI